MLRMPPAPLHIWPTRLGYITPDCCVNILATDGYWLAALTEASLRMRSKIANDGLKQILSTSSPASGRR